MNAIQEPARAVPSEVGSSSDIETGSASESRDDEKLQVMLWPGPDTAETHLTARQHDAMQQHPDYEVKWTDGDEDPKNPRSALWSPVWRKWLIVVIVSSTSVCVTCGSAIYTTTYSQITAEFGISNGVATAGLSVFVSGLGLGPMFLSPLSELYGRRPVCLSALAMYLIWLIPCAIAKNISTMLAARFFDGLAGSAFLSVAGGTIGDIFPKEKLSMPMAIYTASGLLGPTLGPALGGFINEYADWRWSFNTLIIWSAMNVVLLALLVPETYTPKLLKNEAAERRERTCQHQWWAPLEITDRSISRTVLRSCVRPILLLYHEHMCLNLCLLSALLLAVLYLFFGAFPLIFHKNYDFELWQTGLTFMGLFVGMILGVCCDPIWQRNYRRLVKINNGISEPEFRLASTILGSILVLLGTLAFGWTSFPSIHWMVPITFTSLFGIGTVFCFSGIFTFLVECYPIYAASALAANSFTRAILAATFPLFGVQMYNELGFQWATSLLAFIMLALTPFPIVFFYYGKRMRTKSRYATTRSLFK